MKKIFAALLVLLLSVSAYAQLGNIIKKAKKVTDKVSTKAVKVDLFEEKNITTSIDDAMPIAFWLKDLDKYRKPVEPEVYDFDNLEPGYYTFTLQSYCLRAGTHGPTKGDGYLLAPLEGKRADLVYSILKKSADHPEIAQRDIQVLLWGIEAGTKFSDFDRDFQKRVRPLLSGAEMTEMSLDLKNVPLDVMPDSVKKVAKFYSDFRAKLTNPNIPYSQLESMAVLRGALPDEPFAEYVEEGNWAYVGNGFYGRAQPNSYPSTVYELYKPSTVDDFYDDKGRLVRLEEDGYSMEIEYDDSPGGDVISFGSKGDYPIWRMTAIRLQGPKRGQDELLENPGWMIKDDGERLDSAQNGLKSASPRSALAMGLQGGSGKNTSKRKNTSNRKGDPTEKEYKKRKGTVVLSNGRRIATVGKGRACKEWDESRERYDKCRDEKRHSTIDNIDCSHLLLPMPTFEDTSCKLDGLKNALAPLRNNGQSFRAAPLRDSGGRMAAGPLHGKGQVLRTAFLPGAGAPMAVAASSNSGQGNWTDKFMDMVDDWGNDLIGGLAGNCDDDDGPPDIENGPAVPGNTGKQRIGISKRPVNANKRP
ncbi:MAG: hypothetical protein LBT74_07215 [Acidobacteriota bacterium]|jgi:hypothetical protein|nr:hypothetical protein [Acidobacteriota bacterium]